VRVPVEIDEELYRRLAEAAAREGKDVQAYVNEIIRVQLREVERAHQIMSALDDIAGPDQED
jgi:predicted DNA-binding protein